MKIKGQEIREYVREYQRLIDKYKREGIKVHTRMRIASDMGLSVQQADRYKHIFLLISEIQELIFTDKIGMSSVYPIATHSVAEQYEIYHILQEAIHEKYKMVRPCIAQIVSEYRRGNKIWEEIKPACSRYALKVSPRTNMQRSTQEVCDPVESLDSIKMLSGDEFVLWFAHFLEKIGYSGVKVIDASFDEGADIIAQKNGINYCFQCKNQKKRVSLSAFQQVNYGKPDNCNIPVVVTTGSIAKTAMRSGERHGIQSWDGEYLAHLIEETQQHEI